MRFKAKDMDTYLQAVDYVDTALVPLVQATWLKEPKTAAQTGEFALLLAEELERQFRGRVMLLSPFSYTSSETIEERVLRLTHWYEELAVSFKHVVLLTSDGTWKPEEGQLDNMRLLFVPSVPLEFVEPANRRELLNGQLKQLMPVLTDAWQQNN
ncbi:YpiF family protein [Shouchella shacheensis]|uniref:YpiF family protein n=1 Tax=Shouchella shacheensis TaxID=1649580 RepID=UPI0007400DD1|nr:YpiF family protein [Shouchella shacheensis]